MRGFWNGPRILVGRRCLYVGHPDTGWRVLLSTNDLLDGPLVPPYTEWRRVGQADSSRKGMTTMRVLRTQMDESRTTSAGPPESASPHKRRRIPPPDSPLRCAVSGMDPGFWWAGAACTLGIPMLDWRVLLSTNDLLDGPLVPPYTEWRRVGQADGSRKGMTTMRVLHTQMDESWTTSAGPPESASPHKRRCIPPPDTPLRCAVSGMDPGFWWAGAACTLGIPMLAGEFSSTRTTY